MHTEPLLACWQDSLLKPVVLCGSLWISWEYVSAAVNYGVFHHSFTCDRDKRLDRTCQATGTPLSAKTVQHNLNRECVSFPSLSRWLQLGWSAGTFAEWSGTGHGAATATAPLLCSSGRGQHGTLSWWASPQGRRGRSCSRLSLEGLLSAQELSLGSVC